MGWRQMGQSRTSWEHASGLSCRVIVLHKALIRHGCAAEGASGSRALQRVQVGAGAATAATFASRWRGFKVPKGSQSTINHPTPTTLVSSIDGPELVCLQLRPAGCHHLSLQIGFNLSIQVGTDQRFLPPPMHPLEFLQLLLLIEARSSKEDISTCRLVVALADVRMRVVAAIGEAPAAEVAWARHQPQKLHGQALHLRA